MKRIAALILLACMSSQAAAAFAPFVVSDIRIEGLQRISAGTVLTYLPVEKGDTVTDDNVRNSIRTLFHTGFFKDVSIDRQGDIMIIKVVERPAIASINLRGNKDIKDKDLLEGLTSMGITTGQTFDRLSLDRLQRELVRQYYNRGKYNVSVEPHVTPLTRNRVSIDIEIHEGKAAAIERINIVGNTSFSDKAIRRNFESDSTNWTSWYSNDNQYSREKLSGDLEKLSHYYLDRGYADFSIDSTQVAISPDKRAMYITADISEGEKYKIDQVTLLGDLVLPREDIDKMVVVREGQYFSHTLIQITKRGIVALLGNIGYAFAEVTPIPELDRNDHTVDVSFYVKPGPRVYVRRINFIGNSRTRDEVARREMRQFEGGWYSQAAIDRSRARLLRTGYFNSVYIDPVKVPGSPDKVDLNVTVEEQSAGSLQLGIGYSQLSGFIGSFSVSQNNFLGTGRSLSAHIQRSSYLEQYQLSYSDPYLTDSGVSIGYNLTWSELDRGNANIANFLYSNRSFETFFGVPLSENNSIRFGLGISSNTVNVFEGFTPQPLVDYIKDLGHRTIHSWTASVGWGRDTRNRFFLPTRGGKQTISARVALPGSTVEYYKLYYNIEHYWHLPLDFVLYASGNVGYGDTYGKDSERDYPYWQNYYAGGVRDVRGFRDNTLGPRVPIPNAPNITKPIGGSFKVLGTAELYFPIPALRDSTTARVGAFVDVGNVFADFDAYQSSELRASAGLTLTWRAPIGPMSISIAQPLRSQDSDQTERIQFTLGSEF